MALPRLTSADVEAIVPNCKVVASALGGGQKIVYPCCIDGHRCAVKFILLGELKDDRDGDVQSKIDTVRARVEREIAIMRKIDSPTFAECREILHPESLSNILITPPDSLARIFQFQLIYTLMQKVFLQPSNSYVSQITFLHL